MHEVCCHCCIGAGECLCACIYCKFVQTWVREPVGCGLPWHSLLRVLQANFEDFGVTGGVRTCTNNVLAYRAQLCSSSLGVYSSSVCMLGIPNTDGQSMSSGVTQWLTAEQFYSIAAVPQFWCFCIRAMYLCSLGFLCPDWLRVYLCKANRPCTLAGETIGRMPGGRVSVSVEY